MTLKNFLRRLIEVRDEKKFSVSHEIEELNDIVEQSVEINVTDYDATSISSSLKYAVLKYGKTIYDNPNLLKNILSDLAPSLTREIKLIY